MLTLAPAPTANTASTQLRLFRLSGAIFLLCWTADAPSLGRLAVSLSGGGRRLASASVPLTLNDGRPRAAVIFRHGGHHRITATLSDHGKGGPITVRFDPALIQGLAEPSEILRELTPGAKLTLANALVGPWPTLFKLSAAASYLSFLRQFLLDLTPKPSPAAPVASLVEGKVLVETAIQAGLGALKAVFRLDGAGLARLDLSPHLGPADRVGRCQVHLVLDQAPVRGAGLLVLQGAAGLVTRLLPARPATPSLGRWWAGKASARDGLRNWLVEQLAGLSDQGRLLAIEMQRRLPLAVQSVRRNDDLPSAELDLALCNAGGLLLGGWLRDQDGVLEQILLHRAAGAPLPILDQIERFPALLPTGPGGDLRPATGFAARIAGYAGGAPILQPRCELKLKSGTSLFLRPAVQPADPVAIRARALAAIPPQHLTAAMLERTLAPMLVACQAQLRESRPEPTTRQIGKPLLRPVVSIVIPLYRVYEFLRIQIAAFAGDAWIAENAELIYVLDSPEHEAEVGHLLGGLHLAYGLPVQFVVMGRNGGFSAACNAGAAMARGEALALVNSDVIPAGNGWLQALVRKLDRRGGVGAVGPKLLYDDDSLQHAGLYFKRDTKGVWLNHHYFKGMPAAYAPANVEKSVPGVTGACIVLPRDLFDELGGFDDGYVIGDYEDSDLCLKIGRAGYGIRYVPSVALYHIERQSISKSLDYARGVASQHNAWLQTQRWNAQIERLMATIDAPSRHPALREPGILSRTSFRRATAA